MTRPFQILRTQDGFSLVELIVVASLTLVVLTALYNIFITGMDNYNMIDQQNRAVRDAGKNMSIIARYLRQSEGLRGPLELGDPGDYGVSTRVDLDNDTRYEYVTFQLNAASRQLRVTFKEDDGSTSTQVYAEAVRNMDRGAAIFTYYDVNGNRITNAAERASRTASIQIRLITDVDTAKPPVAFDESTTITLRNTQM